MVSTETVAFVRHGIVVVVVVVMVVGVVYVGNYYHSGMGPYLPRCGETASPWWASVGTVFRHERGAWPMVK